MGLLSGVCLLADRPLDKPSLGGKNLRGVVVNRAIFLYANRCERRSCCEQAQAGTRAKCFVRMPTDGEEAGRVFAMEYFSMKLIRRAALPDRDGALRVLVED